MKFLITILLVLFTNLMLFAEENNDEVSQIVSTEAISIGSSINEIIQSAEKQRASNPWESIKLYKIALDKTELKDNNAAKSDILMELGKLNRFVGRFNESIESLNNALAIYEYNSQKQQIAEALIEISRTYYAIGSIEKALEPALKALRIVQNLNNYYLTASIQNDIGAIYSDMKQYTQAMDFFLKSLALYQSGEHREELANTFKNIGTTYLGQGQPYKALDFQTQALQYVDSDNTLKYQILMNIGECYVLSNKYDNAFEYFEKAKYLAESIKFSNGIANSKLKIAELNVNKKNYSLSKKFLLESKQIFVEEQNYAKLSEVYRLLSLVEENSGKTKEAFEYFKNYKAIEDSLFSENQAEKLYRLQVEFDLDNTTSKLATINNEARLQKELLQSRDYIITGVAAFALFFVGFTFYFYKNYRKNKILSDNLINLNNELEEKNKKLIDSENVLRETNAIKDKFYSIIAHDIRNPLNPISVGIEILKQRNNMKMDILNQDKVINDIGKSIKMLSDLLENLLQWTNFQKGTMPFNPALINLYIIIENNKSLLSQSLKQKEILLFSDVKENDTVYADPQMLNTIMRNLISNAIKYTKPGGVIKISINKKDDSDEISVIDTGVGMPEDVVNQLFRNDSFITKEGTHAEKGTGLGLKICKEFVEKHNGRISCRSLMNSGSTFKFSLPKEDNI